MSASQRVNFGFLNPIHGPGICIPFSDRAEAKIRRNKNETLRATKTTTTISNTRTSTNVSNEITGQRVSLKIAVGVAEGSRGQKLKLVRATTATAHVPRTTRLLGTNRGNVAQLAHDRRRVAETPTRRSGAY